VFQRNESGNVHGVLLDDARGDADVFGIGSVVEEQIFAEILLAALAEVALAAGRGVDGHDSIADGEAGDACSDLGDDS